MNAKEIVETIAASCALAEVLKSKGDLKGAREQLDGVAEILDRLMYLRERRGAE